MNSSNCSTTHAGLADSSVISTSGSSLRQRGRGASTMRWALPALAAVVLSVASAEAQLVIGNSTGLFAPSFRDPITPFDEDNTTWFGWGAGSFDGAIDNELIDNPAVTLGVGGLDGSLIQLGTVDILSSSNSIYSFAGPETLRLTIPTNGTAGLDGFTTIILQGKTAFGGFSPEGLSFGAMGGVMPEEVAIGANAVGGAQFWVKYQLPIEVSSFSSHTVDIGLPQHTSIAELTVDTQWSTSGYAPDSVQAVPEPGSIALLFAGMAPLALRRWRKSLPSAA